MLKRFTKQLKSRKAFTLIELIVVLAILGILAAIIFPSLNGYKDKANATVDSTNAKLLSNVAAMISADTGSYPAWAATFTEMSVADAQNLISQPIEYREKTGTFTYDVETGLVSSPTSGGVTPTTPPSAPSLAGVTLTITGATNQNPTITLPLLGTMPSGVTAISWAASHTGNGNLVIATGVATFTRDTITYQLCTGTITLTATWSGGQVTKAFVYNIPAPSWNGSAWTYPAVTLQ